VSRTLIAGLGNPGRKYQGTRHNIGFRTLDQLAGRYRLDVTQSKFDGLYTTGRIAGADVLLLKPQTFMNKSGKSVQAARDYYGISAGDTIVLHDDIDLEVGQLKVKSGGGHGGHNGLRDIVQKTGDRDFVRIRLGVGRPEHGNVRNYVLSSFDSGQQADVDELVEIGCDAVETVLSDGVARAQNLFH